MSRVKSNKYQGVYVNTLKNGDVSYSITYEDSNGKKVWLKIGLKSHGVREAYCSQKRNEILFKIRNGEDLPHVASKKESYTFFEAFKYYLEFAKVNKKTWKHNDQGVYYTHLHNTFGDRQLRTLTSEDFETLKIKLLTIGKAPSTVRKIFDAARSIINYSIKHRKIQNYENPISDGKVKMPKLDNQRLGFFSKGEMNKLLIILSKRKSLLLYDLTIILLHTGARFGEVTSLTWNDVNFEQNLIFFKKTKDGNERYIFMSEPLLAVVKRYYESIGNHIDLVIPSPRTGRKIDSMPKQWQDIVDKLIPNNKTKGKYKLVPHSLRHTHASWLAIEGTDIRHIQVQLGHKTLEMTERYSHLIPDKRYEQTQNIFKNIS